MLGTKVRNKVITMKVKCQEHIRSQQRRKEQKRASIEGGMDE